MLRKILVINCLNEFVFQVKEDDNLPKKICDDCSKKLASWQNFYKKCEQTQKRLQQYLENWQKSSIYVPSSNQNSVTCAGSEKSNTSKDLSQISFGDKTPADTTQTKPSVLPKQVKNISSVHSETKAGIFVITKKCRTVEYKHREDANKVNNVSDNSNSCQEKVKSSVAGSQKKNACPEETDNTTEQTHSVEGLKENEQLQTNFTTEAIECVKRLKFSKSSLKTKKYIEVHHCHICEKTFCSRGKLNVHVAAHLSLPEFQCNNCSKKFRSKFSLRYLYVEHNLLSHFIFRFLPKHITLLGRLLSFIHLHSCWSCLNLKIFVKCYGRRFVT
jgi:hypothetical protein